MANFAPTLYVATLLLPHLRAQRLGLAVALMISGLIGTGLTAIEVAGNRVARRVRPQCRFLAPLTRADEPQECPLMEVDWKRRLAHGQSEVIVESPGGISPLLGDFLQHVAAPLLSGPQARHRFLERQRGPHVANHRR